MNDFRIDSVGSREAFEAWASNSKGNAWFKTPDTEHGYVDGITNVAFLAFQAARNAQAQRISELESVLAEAKAFMNRQLKDYMKHGQVIVSQIEIALDKEVQKSHTPK